ALAGARLRPPHRAVWQSQLLRRRSAAESELNSEVGKKTPSPEMKTPGLRILYSGMAAKRPALGTRNRPESRTPGRLCARSGPGEAANVECELVGGGNCRDGDWACRDRPGRR